MDEPEEYPEPTVFCNGCRCVAPLWAMTDSGLCVMCFLPDEDETNMIPEEDEEPEEALSEPVNWKTEGF